MLIGCDGDLGKRRFCDIQISIQEWQYYKISIDRNRDFNLSHLDHTLLLSLHKYSCDIIAGKVYFSKTHGGMSLKICFSFQCSILFKKPEGTLAAVMIVPWNPQTMNEQDYAI